MKGYIDERLPEEYEKCLVGINAITREAWNAAKQTEDKRKDTGIIFSKELLFNEAGFAY
jgi:hypothetical protein